MSDPIYVGYGPKVTPEDPHRGQFGWSITVETTGALRGTIQRIDLRLTDAVAGTALGSDARIGPFLNPRDGRRPNQVVDPLLETGRQTYIAGLHDFGFVGRPAALAIAVTIKDPTGKIWVANATPMVELFPTPVIRSPANVTVTQNDPRSGCGYDQTHGWGLVVEVAWDAPPGHHVDHYTVAIADGFGRELTGQFYAITSETTYRLVRCSTHVSLGAERARAAVSATNSLYKQLSGFDVARFNFQSCHEAGTPACQ